MNASSWASDGRPILVTGASGFIGSAVVRHLVARGLKVRCLLRRGSDTRRIAAFEFERAEGDICDPASVRRAMQGCCAAIHLACLSSWDQIHSPRMFEVAVEGTRHVLDAALEAGLERVVYTSSVLAIAATRAPRPLDESSASEVALDHLRYSSAKRQAEDLCAAANRKGLPVVIVNPGEVYGPQDDALVTAGNLIDFATSWPVLVCDGGVGVTHVDDIAKGILAALHLGRPGERYILAGENLSIRQIASLTLDILGLRKPVLGFPNPLVKALAWLGNNLRVPLPFSPAVIPYATLYWFADTTKARAELGIHFRPARETLSATLAWLRESGRLPQGASR